MKTILQSKLILVLLLFFLNTTLSAQEVDFRLEDFKMTGTTHQAGDQCFNLTTNDFWQGGGLWFKNRVDLNEPFNMEIDLFN